MRCYSSGSNGDHQFPLPCNHLETVSILQGYPMQVPVNKEVDGDVNCGSSVSEFPFPQKVKQTDDHFKALWHSPDSENTSKNGNVKLFGKILTNSSSNLIIKGSEENSTNHTKSSNESYKRKITSHQNSDGNLKILKFDRADYHGLENVQVKSYGFWGRTHIVSNALIHMHLKCGSIDLAWREFSMMRYIYLYTYSAMIAAFAKHGKSQDVIDLFLKIKQEGLKPNQVTFVGVLNACSASGLIEEGCRFFQIMTEVYGIEPLPSLWKYGIG